MAHSDGVTWQAHVQVYRRRRGDPLTRPLKVFTRDSTTSRVDGAIATIEIPWEPLDPGPLGALFAVDPLDGEDKNGAVDLDDPRVLIRGGLDAAVSDPQFHQQMVYALCSKLYSQFEQALGRSIAWGFDSSKQNGRLLLRPHAKEIGANAAYEKDLKRISFGYFAAPEKGAGRNAPNGHVFTCLSHDIISHEFTHALLDGLRSHFSVPTSNDVLGFHEGFADLVALFQHFTYRELLEKELRRCDGDLDHSMILANLAEEFGRNTQGGPLRCAITTKVVPYSPDMEVHEMGSVLLCAVFEAFRRVFQRKTEPFLRLAYRPPSGYMVSELAGFLASKASELASQFLSMCIRAIDYCPPVDLQMGEFLRALITADHELVPDDPMGYRDALISAFAERGIYPPGVGQLCEDSLLWQPPLRAMEPVHALHFAILRFAGDPSLPASESELVRQAEALWDFITRPHVAKEFGLAPAGGDYEPCMVESIRTSRRVGPDGQVLFDLVAEVTQRRHVVHKETGVKAKFFGGATIIVGPDGVIRYVIAKSVQNEDRLARQLDYQGRSTAYWSNEGGQYKMRGSSNALAHWRK